MKHALLIGEYPVSADEKHRVLVPASVRQVLDPERDGEMFYATVGVNRKLWLYPQKYYEALIDEEPADLIPADDALAYDQMKYSLTTPLPWDKSGRVLIPKTTLELTGLGTDLVMIGVRDHLELWNLADWRMRRDALLAAAPEIALRAKQARKVQQ